MSYTAIRPEALSPVQTPGESSLPSAPARERRRAERLRLAATRWAGGARLRPEHDIRILDIGPGGALFELPVRMLIGGRVELSLVDGEARIFLDLNGIVRRCQVARLDPLVYRGAVEFDEMLEPGVLRPLVLAHATNA